MLLLANAPRSTKDRDIFWLEEDGLQQVYTPLRKSVQIIKQKHDLDADWFNYLAQMLLYDEVIVPDGKLWKRFGPIHVYAPAREYILALKIAAGAFHFFAPASRDPTGVEGGSLRNGLRQE